MTRMKTAVLIVLPLLAACSEDTPTAPEASALALSAASANAARPMDGRCETVLTPLPTAGDPPNMVRLHIEYVCELTHLGRATAAAEQVVIFTGPTTAIASNTATYTAANGDQLFAAWTGTSTTIGPDITFSGTETYAGGTGRFADASGSAWISGTASFVSFTGQFTSSGTLNY